MGCHYNAKVEEQQNMNIPDELFSKILSEKTWTLDITHYTSLSSWLHKDKVICIIDSNNERLIYLIKDNKFRRLNCIKGIQYINEILNSSPFSEESFSDIEKVQQFLRVLLNLYQGPDGCIASKSFLEREERGEDGISIWILGMEEKESVFRSLCSDPVVEIKNGNWEITFNFFNSLGGVERWIITGDIEKINKHPRVHSISSERIKENSTFVYPVVG
jgi:hypothetical protein